MLIQYFVLQHKNEKLDLFVYKKSKLSEKITNKLNLLIESDNLKMRITDLTTANFIAGYKHHPDHEDVFWLCNHPESLDLIFSKDKTTAFTFEDEQAALTAIQQILAAENHSWYTPIVENFQAAQSASTPENEQLNLKQMEAKINEYLKLFNERSNSRLKLFLTLNKKENSIRGYGAGVKLGDAVINFVALLAIKGISARCLDRHTFIVKLADK